MKFLLYFCCLSIVGIIALTGCGPKRYENIPHDPIHLQAKVDAESDAKHDVNLLAYFGAGMSAPLAAGMCALMSKEANETLSPELAPRGYNLTKLHDDTSTQAEIVKIGELP